MRMMIFVAACCFSCGCSLFNGGGGSRGIQAPSPAIGGQVQAALNDAYNWLRTRPGGQNLRPFDPSKDRLIVRVVDPIGTCQGQPVMEWRNGRDCGSGWIGARADARSLSMARGTDGSLVFHEGKHVILEINGRVAESRNHDPRYFPEGSNVF